MKVLALLLIAVMSGIPLYAGSMLLLSGRGGKVRLMTEAPFVFGMYILVSFCGLTGKMRSCMVLELAALISVCLLFSRGFFWKNFFCMIIFALVQNMMISFVQMIFQINSGALVQDAWDKPAAETLLPLTGYILLYAVVAVLTALLMRQILIRIRLKDSPAYLVLDVIYVLADIGVTIYKVSGISGDTDAMRKNFIMVFLFFLFILLMFFLYIRFLAVAEKREYEEMQQRWMAEHHFMENLLMHEGTSRNLSVDTFLHAFRQEAETHGYSCNIFVQKMELPWEKQETVMQILSFMLQLYRRRQEEHPGRKGVISLVLKHTDGSLLIRSAVFTTEETGERNRMKYQERQRNHLVCRYLKGRIRETVAARDGAVKFDDKKEEVMILLPLEEEGEQTE